LGLAGEPVNDTIRRLRDADPELPVVIMTASSPAGWHKRDAAQISDLEWNSVSSLGKPFLPDALRTTVKRMLG
jgi:DNA-binding response OmpR family regulator